MKNKIVLLVSFLMFIVFILVGCSGESSKIKINVDNKDVSSWEVEGDVRFVPIERQHIKDGTTNGIDFITFVDLKTGEMYLHTEKFKSGYGVTFTKLNEIYEDLEQLRNKYNYSD